MKLHLLALFALTFVSIQSASAQPAFSKDPKDPVLLDVKLYKSKPLLLLNQLPIDRSELLDVLTDWEKDFGKDHPAVIIFEADVPLATIFELREEIMKSAYKNVRMFVILKDRKELKEVTLNGASIPITEKGFEIGRLLEAIKK